MTLVFQSLLSRTKTSSSVGLGEQLAGGNYKELSVFLDQGLVNQGGVSHGH